MKNLVFLFVALCSLVGCEKAENTARSVARKTGDLVGKGAGEFFSGVGDGVRSVADGSVPDVLSAIASRKSVRTFDSLKKVDEAAVEKILRAGMAAPSAMDRRPFARSCQYGCREARQVFLESKNGACARERIRMTHSLFRGGRFDII